MKEALLRRAPRRAASLFALVVVAMSIAFASQTGTAPAGAATADPASTTTATTGTADDGASSLPPAPKLAAPAWIVLDATDGTAIAGSNTEVPVPIASLTKLMTALVVVERTKGNEIVRMSNNAVSTGGGSSIGVQAGEEYTVDNLLRAMLVYSANDAAVALAEHVGGSEKKFIDLMNERATRLELTRSTFTSVTGLDDDKGNRSTAADIAQLGLIATRDTRISRTVRTETIDFPAKGGSIKLNNRNQLLGAYKGVDGVKTGHTDDAGYCLLTHYADKPSGSSYFTLVLGAKTEAQRDGESRKLLDWAKSLRPEVTFANAADPIAEAPVAYSDRRAHLFIADHVSAFVRRDKDVSERVILPATLQRPIRAGDEVGRYEALVDGEVVGTTPIYVQEGFAGMSLLDRAKYHSKRVDDAWASGTDSARDAFDQQREYWGL